MRKASTPLLVLSVILLLFANLGLWLSATIYNSQKFSDIVVGVYEQPDVRNAIAGQIVDETLQAKPILNQTLGDQIQSAIAGILGSQASKKIFQKASLKYQEYLTTDNRKNVTIEVGQIASFIKPAATAVSSDLGAQVPDITPRTITIVKSDSVPDINKWLKPIMWLGPIAGLVSVLILVYLLLTTEDKAKILRKIGIFFTTGIVLFALLIPYVRFLIQGNINDQNTELVVVKTYDAFIQFLVNQLIFIAIIFALIFLIGYFMKLSNENEGGSNLIIHRKENVKNGNGLSKK